MPEMSRDDADAFLRQWLKDAGMHWSQYDHLVWNNWCEIVRLAYAQGVSDAKAE